MQTNAQQSNVHFSYTMSTTASKAAVWRVWTNVPGWKDWDKGLRSAELYGQFADGARGRLVPLTGPRAKFRIQGVQPGEAYTFKTRIPLGWLVVRRFMEYKNGQLFFTHKVMFTGPFKKILARKLGGEFRQMLPEVMNNVRLLAEQQ